MRCLQSCRRRHLFRTAQGQYRVPQRLKKGLRQFDGDGVPDLDAARHYPSLEIEPIRKRLKASRLPQSNAMMLRGVHETTLGRVYASRRHCRPGHRRIDPAIYVVMPDMVLVTRKNPSGLTAPTAVWRRLGEGPQ